MGHLAFKINLESRESHGMGTALSENKRHIYCLWRVPKSKCNSRAVLKNKHICFLQLLLFLQLLICCFDPRFYGNKLWWSLEYAPCNEGIMTKLLRNLYLPTLESLRKADRLCKKVEAKFPAVSSESYLIYQPPRQLVYLVFMRKKMAYRD